MTYHLHLTVLGELLALDGVDPSDSKEFLGVWDIPEEYKNFITWHGSKKMPVIDYAGKRVFDFNEQSNAWNQAIEDEKNAREAEQETTEYWNNLHSNNIVILTNTELIKDIEYSSKTYDADDEAVADITAYLEGATRQDADAVSWRLADNTSFATTVGVLKAVLTAIQARRITVKQHMHIIKDELAGKSLADLKTYSVNTRYTELTS